MELRWLFTTVLKQRPRTNQRQLSGVWGLFLQTGPSEKEAGTVSTGPKAWHDKQCRVKRGTGGIDLST